VTRFALHCSHDQIPPSRLVRAARRAADEALRVAHDQWRTNVLHPPLR
jgi:hypothetical protein